VIECKTGRQLNQNGATLGAETGGLLEELVKAWLRVEQSLFVGDHLGQLYREAETLRNRIGPALVGRSPMWSIEARVDFDGVEKRGISLEMTANVGEPV
jgi:hypothetical protein